MGNKKYACVIGRWQSPHRGHRWLIEQDLKAGKPVLILVRDVETDEKNPFTAHEVKQMLEAAFSVEVESKDVVVQVIPDISSFAYGRAVGYDVVCRESQAPEHIKRISATEIRRKIREGDDSWKELVMPGTEEFIEAKFHASTG